MEKKYHWKKEFSTVFLVLFLFLACAAFMGLKLQVEEISRKKVPGSSIIYIPSGKYLKYATFGFSSFAADLVYLWAIQYYSDETISDRFKYLDHVFSIIAELDPRYADPYEVGAMIAVYEARDLDTALRILDRGLAKNPDQWIYPFQAGHYAQRFKDYELARKYYQKAMNIPAAPDIAKRLYAFSAFKLQDIKTSWEMWLEIYNTTKDERIKKIASNQLYQVKSAMDVRAVGEAIAKFREKFGRNPATLDQLVKAGFMLSAPKDLDNKDYLYDSKTGEVKPPSIWWKR